MKNPFEKKDNSGLIVGIVLGSLAAGAVAYLFLTETGTAVREQLTGHLNRVRDAIKGGAPADEPENDEPPEYLQKKQKAPKTNREDLLKNHILSEHGDAEASAE